MALIRVFCKLDVQHKIILPAGVCKELNIKPGDKLELTVAGPNRARKLVIIKKSLVSKLAYEYRRQSYFEI